MKVMIPTYKWHMGSSLRVYTENLATGLSNLPDIEVRINRLKLYRAFSIPIPSVKDLIRASSESLRSDLVHIPLEGSVFNFVLPLIPNICCVLTVHDIVSFVLNTSQNYDDNYLRMNRFSRYAGSSLGKAGIKIGISEADSIICPSQTICTALANTFKISRKRISVIPHGVNHNLFRPINKMAARQLIGIPVDKRIILNVGSEARRKNLTTLFNAFAKICKNSDNYVLIRVGNNEEANEKLLSKYVPKEKRNRILFFSGVEDRMMPYFYSSADVFVFPSVFEGFGLPVLEAMACGCPVIASNTSSIPEIVDDAGILLDPFSVDAFSESIESVIEDSDQLELRRKSFEQSKRFSWEKCANETLKLYMDTYRSVA
jgi:glycosyltransferase involved in cell wall biosynthesis